MTFTGKELASIVKLAKLMAFADGRIDKNELKMISAELIRFGAEVSDMKNLMKYSDEMEMSDAIRIVTTMTQEEKKYVSSYLGTLMSIDGNIDDSELKVWMVISKLCGLPQMNIPEAITNMANL